MKEIDAWYFSGTDKKLRYGDGREIIAGEKHSVKGKIVICENGLHGSERIIDALSYAPGPYIWRVKLSGNMYIHSDKIAARHREYIWGFDATDVLREFARKQALINIDKIKQYCKKNEYNLILKWLETGDEKLRIAAKTAAWSAAESAVWSAADKMLEDMINNHREKKK